MHAFCVLWMHCVKYFTVSDSVFDRMLKTFLGWSRFENARIFALHSWGYFALPVTRVTGLALMCGALYLFEVLNITNVSGFQRLGVVGLSFQGKMVVIIQLSHFPVRTTNGVEQCRSVKKFDICNSHLTWHRCGASARVPFDWLFST